MDDTAAEQFDAIGLSAQIVSAFVSNNSVRALDLPALITSVHAAVAGLANGNATAAPADGPKVQKATPAQIRKSITPDALISFVDGKPYKTLKRHLSTHGLDFASYRTRYGLPTDYPTVAQNYSANRSALAKQFGLGSLRSKGAAKDAEASERSKSRPQAKAD